MWQVQPVWEVQACLEDLGEEERPMLTRPSYSSAGQQWGENCFWYKYCVPKFWMIFTVIQNPLLDKTGTQKANAVPVIPQLASNEVDTYLNILLWKVDKSDWNIVSIHRRFVFDLLWDTIIEALTISGVWHESLLLVLISGLGSCNSACSALSPQNSFRILQSSESSSQKSSESSVSRILQISESCKPPRFRIHNLFPFQSGS